MAVQFMEDRLFHFVGHAMGLLHYIYDVFQKHALAKVKPLAAHRRLQHRRQVAPHHHHFLNGDGQRSAVALGESGLDTVDDGNHGAVADRVGVVRDGPRVVIFGTRK